MKEKRLRVVADENSKTFVTHLILGPGDRFYCPDFDDKSYLIVPDDFVIHFPFNYVNSDMITTRAKWIRFNHEFRLTDTSYSYHQQGYETPDPTLHQRNNPLNFRYLLDEWVENNLYRYFDKERYGSLLYNDIQKHKADGYKYLTYDFVSSRDKHSDTRKFGRFYAPDLHAKAISKLPTPKELL